MALVNNISVLDGTYSVSFSTESETTVSPNLAMVVWVELLNYVLVKVGHPALLFISSSSSHDSPSIYTMWYSSSSEHSEPDIVSLFSLYNT